MIEDRLGPMPEPTVEPPDDSPGGTDSIEVNPPIAGDEPGKLGHDLHPDDNPGVDAAMPAEVGAAEDTQQENEGDGASDPQNEPPA